MFIRKVTIINFKSYKEKVVFDDLSPKLNLLVGDNGSGKTNFLDAIMFALGRDSSKGTKRRDWRAVLYDSDMPGSVELLFGIIGQPRQSVRGKKVSSIKREISWEDDKFFVNGKSISEDNLHRMLEISGLLDIGCRHQYIKQEMISYMATASNAELLKLLNVASITNKDENHEAAVSQEYECVVQNNTSHSSTVEDYITNLREQIRVLEKVTYWSDKQQALELALRSQRSQEATKKMTQLEEEKTKLKEKLDSLKYDLHSASEAKLIARRIMFKQSILRIAEEKLQKMNEEQKTLAAAEKILRVVVEDLKDQIPRCRHLKEAAEGRINSLNDTMKQIAGQLEDVNSSLEEIKLEENDIGLNLAAMLRKTEELQAKQVRLERFTSKDARDREIRKELEALKEQLGAKLSDQRRCKEELRKYAVEVGSLTDESERPAVAMDELKDAFLESSKELFECEIKKDQQERKTRILAEKATVLEYKLSLLREELNTFDNEFCGEAERDVFEGQASVATVLGLWKRRGGFMANVAATNYHGMVIDCFDCDWTVYVPICVTVGKKLFRHIVDSSEVAEAIMEEVKRQKLPGRIEFLYLDRLRSVDQFYPEVEYVIPLMEKLIYEPKYQDALIEVFGKILICTSFKMSASLVDMFDCVTYEGQQVSLKGFVMSGELPDSSPTIIDVHKHRRSLKKDVGDVQEELERTREKMLQEKNKLNSLFVENNTLEGNYREFIYRGESDFQLKGEFVLSSQLVRKEMEFGRESAKELKNIELANCDMSVAVLRTAIEVREAELLEELSAGLPSENQMELNSLREEIFSRNESAELTRQKRIQLEVKKDSLTEQLKICFFRRNDMIVDLMQNSVDYKEELLRQKGIELTLVRQNIQESTEEMEEMIESLRTNRKKTMEEVSVRRENEAKVKNVKENLKEMTNKFLSMVDTWFAQKCRVQAYIAENKPSAPKSLQSDQHRKYFRWNMDKILEKLRKLNHKLKKSSHFSNNATEEISTLCRKHERMMGRTEKLENQRRFLEQFSGESKNKGVEIVENVFEKLRRHFLEKFRAFVPEGTADLYVQTADGEEGNIAAALGSYDCNGLAIRASFGESDWQGEMCEFSIGQQTVIALALIFALQECYQLPFVLLDEVDKAFSVGPYADAFYDLIRILSNKSQFIATSFSPEMLNCTDRIYGVELRNRAGELSRLYSCDFTVQMSYACLVDENIARQYLRNDGVNNN